MALYWPGGRGHADSADMPDLGSYDSNHLLDSILDQLHLPDDAALSEALEVDASVIDELRAARREVDAAMLIRMHELTDISIVGLRNILGDRRRKSRFAEEAKGSPALHANEGDAMNQTSKDKDDQDRTPPPAPGGAGQDAARPREISREEMDHQQPADTDPDDPVSP